MIFAIKLYILTFFTPVQVPHLAQCISILVIFIITLYIFTHTLYFILRAQFPFMSTIFILHLASVFIISPILLISFHLAGMNLNFCGIQTYALLYIAPLSYMEFAWHQTEWCDVKSVNSCLECILFESRPVHWLSRLKSSWIFLFPQSKCSNNTAIG